MQKANLLFPMSLILACWILVLIAAGGLVTSFDAGLTIPDWPLSYGEWFPQLSGGMVYEHTHRVIAGGAGIFCLLLVLAITWKDRRGGLKALAWFALGLVVLQALFGGLTVLMQLPAAVSVTHAYLGQAFLGLTVALCFYLSPYGLNAGPAQTVDRASLRDAWIALALMSAQIILGALERHTHRAVLEHIGLGLALSLYLVAFMIRLARVYPEARALQNTSVALGMSLMVQIFLGIGAFSYTRFISPVPSHSGPEIFFTVTHQTTGALMLALGVLILLLIKHPENQPAR
jgi:cytochrome c oxidase assembly protein subunit 15